MSQLQCCDDRNRSCGKEFNQRQVLWRLWRGFMKRFSRLTIWFLTFSTVAFAQDRLLTLDDIFSPDLAKRVRFGGTPVAVQWAADGRSFKQVIGGRLMRVDAMTARAEPYLDSGSRSVTLLVMAGLQFWALQRFGVKTDEAMHSPIRRFCNLTPMRVRSLSITPMIFGFTTRPPVPSSA